MSPGRDDGSRAWLPLLCGLLVMLVLAGDFGLRFYERHAADEGRKVVMPRRVAEHVKLVKETVPVGARVVHLSDVYGETVNLATQRKVNAMIYPTLVDYH